MAALDDFAGRIRHLRLALGITQEQLAARLGVAFSTVNRWENGRARPSPTVWRALRQLEDVGPSGTDATTSVGSATPARWPPSPGGGFLPAPISSFVGRGRELAELAGLLTDCRLVTLTGTGGCGKTRLALEAARSAGRSFPDGVWFVELASLADPSLLPAAIATVLGVRESSGRPLVETLAAFLSDKQLLLLLDNCEHVRAASATLVNALLRGSHKLTVLTTSRELLGLIGETVYALTPLGLPPRGATTGSNTLHTSEAVQLFIERAPLRVSAFDATSSDIDPVVQICVRLDGLPLALELAAARVGSLTVEEIAMRLDDRFRLLVRGQAEPARHETLRAAIDWSYDLLDASEQGMFRRLSVFPGSFDMAAADAVSAGDHALELVQRLIEKSLVTVAGQAEGQTRYRLLETLREYGRERLVEAGALDATLGTHAGHFAALAESLARGGDAGLASLDREEDNLRAALTCLRDRGDIEAQLELAATLRFFWVVGGRLREGREWLRPARDSGLRLGPRVRAAALLAAGAIARDLGETANARHELGESLELYQEAGEQRGSVRALNSLASIAQQRGDYASARELFNEALDGCRALGERAWVAQTIGNLGEVALGEGDLVEAERLLEESRALAQVLGHRQAAVSLANLAAVSLYAGATERGRKQAEEAIAELRAVNYPLWLATALETLAVALRCQGETERASTALHESLSLMWKLGSDPGIAVALRGFALLATVEGRFALAVRLFAACDALAARAEVQLPRALPGEVEAALSRSKHELGEARYHAEFSAGLAMTADEAAAFALAQPVSTAGGLPDTSLNGDGHVLAPARAAATLPTPRQQEVLRLVAAGRTTREIAAELVLSARTVERHIENLYAATGLRSRAALTDYAHRHGLVASAT